MTKQTEPTEVAELISSLNTAFDQFKAAHRADVDAVRKQVDENSTALAAFQMNGLGTDQPAADLDGAGIKVLRTPADFKAHYASRRDGNDSQRSNDTTLTDFMRGVAGMSSTNTVMASLAVGTDSAGGYAVPDVVMPGILSALVPASSLLQAGAGIVPMDYGAKSVSTAAIDTMPTASWRNELGTIGESQPTLRSVQAVPRSLACIVRVSRELLADGSDVDRALRLVIAQAFAKELDRVGLLGSGYRTRTARPAQHHRHQRGGSGSERCSTGELPPSAHGVWQDHRPERPGTDRCHHGRPHTAGLRRLGRHHWPAAAAPASDRWHELRGHQPVARRCRCWNLQRHQ